MSDLKQRIPKILPEPLQAKGCFWKFHAWDRWQEPEKDYQISTDYIMASGSRTTKYPFFFQRRHCMRCMIVETRKVK